MIKKLSLMIFAFAFCSSLNAEEQNIVKQKEASALEYKIGLSFAKEGEFTLAAESFKRALILLPEECSTLRDQVNYVYLLSFYRAKRYDKVIQIYENSSLLMLDNTFVAYQDLMRMLYDSYEQTKQYQKADDILHRIESISEKEGKDLKLTQAIFRKNKKKIRDLSFLEDEKKYVGELIDQLDKAEKSPRIAGWLNVFLPGLGYFYVGQKKSALTSFALNALLIATSWQFFVHKHYALGILTGTFELGWYIGGVLGAKEAAKTYNDYLFKNYGNKILSQEMLLPEMRIDNDF